jgi:hypothetical protein
MRNILLTEEQLSYLVNLIKESTEGIDEFISLVKEKYKISDEHLDMIKQFILNSDCKKINVEPIKFSFGHSLSNGVVLSPEIFKLKLGKFLLVLFHEIAHQYQFKKYGGDKMYECYTGEISIEEACKLMKNIEMVADEFATRKISEFVKLGIIKQKDVGVSDFYKKVPLSHFEVTIKNIKNTLKSLDIKDHNKISELFYNYAKSEI